MPTRLTGLKGYVAEAVVARWLRQKFPAPEFEIVPQIIPTEVDRRGGGYLDFGVVRGTEVVAVYEVKGQDYIFTKDSDLTPRCYISGRQPMRLCHSPRKTNERFEEAQIQRRS